VANAKTVNWFDLDRSSLYTYFYSLNKKIVGKHLTPDQIHRLISKHVKQVLPIKVIKKVEDQKTTGYVYMGGVYHSLLDKKGSPAIELNLNYHPTDLTLKLTNYRWQRMSRRFADIIMHEMIHMRQFRTRNFKPIPVYQSNAESVKTRTSQEYLGDRDEMGAFAFNSACEMIDRFGYDPHTIKRYMDTNNATRHSNSWWCDYLKAFEFNHNHKIIRRMKKKIMRQLENAYYGKPFKTADFLTY
jgi:hypothetical protein